MFPSGMLIQAQLSFQFHWHAHHLGQQAAEVNCSLSLVCCSHPGTFSIVQSDPIIADDTFVFRLPVQNPETEKTVKTSLLSINRLLICCFYCQFVSYCKLVTRFRILSHDLVTYENLLQSFVGKFAPERRENRNFDKIRDSFANLCAIFTESSVTLFCYHFI